MKRMTTKFFCPILLSFLLTGCFLGDSAILTDPRLPQPVNDIWRDAQRGNKELEVFRKEIYARYTKPLEGRGPRDQWTFDRGILTIDPVAGAFFVTRENEMIPLIRVRNPLEEALYGAYEMASRPTADYGYEHCWLGNVDLRVDGTYVYKDSGRFLSQRKDQADNFFMLHPSGRFDVTYLNGFGATTLVESIHRGQRIAKLTFRASDRPEKTYFIKAVGGVGLRKLAIDDDEMEFRLESGFL
jgi:hypothetical protein